jgi:hypothetical protein
VSLWDKIFMVAIHVCSWLIVLLDIAIFVSRRLMR